MGIERGCLCMCVCAQRFVGWGVGGVGSGISVYLNCLIGGGTLMSWPFSSLFSHSIR